MKFPHRIDILERTETQNEYKETVTTWQPRLLNVRANVRSIKTSEKFSADKELSRVDLTIRLRRRDWLTTEYRIRWKGKEYSIDGDPLDVNGQRQFIEIACHDINKPRS